ncbi:hypothetical protein J6590_052490 [Homalodisca vitripennis]|nr:hypothetical protein J6590_052490 [Homalodisca vitripennis]
MKIGYQRHLVAGLVSNLPHYILGNHRPSSPICKFQTRLIRLYTDENQQSPRHTFLHFSSDNVPLLQTGWCRRCAMWSALALLFLVLTTQSAALDTGATAHPTTCCPRPGGRVMTRARDVSRHAQDSRCRLYPNVQIWARIQM